MHELDPAHPAAAVRWPRGNDPSGPPLAAVVRRPTSPRPLFAEALGISLAVIGIVWLTWIALWVLDQRW